MEGMWYGMAFAAGGVGAWLLTMLAVAPECRRVRELLDESREQLKASRKVAVDRLSEVDGCQRKLRAERARCGELQDRVTRLEGVISRLSSQSQQIGQEAKLAMAILAEADAALKQARRQDEGGDDDA